MTADRHGPGAGTPDRLAPRPPCGMASPEVAAGHRFAGLMATQRPDGVLLSAHLAEAGGIATRDGRCPPARTRTRR